MKKLLILVCIAGVGGALAAAPAQAAMRPTLAVQNLTVERTKPDRGYAGGVDLKVRLCVSVGPRAVILVRETRSVGRLRKAKHNWIDPLGVDLDHVEPYACASDYLISWIVKSRLVMGRGTYRATIRVRDGFGVLSSPVSFSVTAFGR